MPSPIESGKAFWTVAKRFHQHRDNPTMRPVAVNEMCKLQNATQSQAVLRRVNGFIALHHRDSRSDSPFGGGGRRA
jgi:hypothetical protein